MNGFTTEPDGGGTPTITRRMALKAVAATGGSIALFSGGARATDDDIEFEVECVGDEVRVTLEKLNQSDGDDLDPTDSNVQDLRVVFGKKDVIDRSDGSKWDNGVIDRMAEIVPCVDGADPDDSTTTSWCQPVAYADSESDNTEVEGDDFVFTFERSEAGLDDVAWPTEVALAGLYEDPTEDRDPESFDGTATFDPATCDCTGCDSEGLLVRYDWEGVGFVIDEGGDDEIVLESTELDGDGEPEKACFTTTYCSLDAVVKAGPDHEVTRVEDDEKITEFCVEGIDGRAISNIRFYCEAPDDLDVGNGNENGNGERNGEGR